MEEKVYYKIGEVSRKTGVASHTIRYWEKEFSFLLKPNRNSRGQRLYTEKDLESVTRLKDLLYRHGYRVAAVKRLLHQKGLKKDKREAAAPVKEILAGLKRLDRLLAQIAKI
jgi:DNA-binding transcriptional MerR regulator